MSNIPIKDAAGTTVYAKSTGTGGSGDPYIPEHASTNALNSQADGHSETVGSTTDAVATTDTGTFSLMALIKRLLAKFKLEDGAHTSGDPGIMSLAVRNDAGGALAGTDGDYIPLTTDSTGNLRVAVSGSLTLGSAVDTELTTADLDTGAGTDTRAVVGLALAESGGALLVGSAHPLPVSIASGAGTQYTEDAASAGAENLMLAGAVRRDTAASSSGTDGDYSTLNTDASGKLWTNADVTKVGGTAIDTNSGNKSAGTVRVVLATDQPALTNSLLTTPAGNVAHDGADSGNPVKIGGRARSSEVAAVSNNDRTDLITDLVGKLITLPYANPENFVSGAITTAMTGTTSTSLVAAPGAGLRNYITTIIVSNSHATVGTDIIIQDGSGGTTLLTIPAAAVYGGAAITLPVPLRQPNTATAIYAQNVTTGASTKVSAIGYIGA